MFDSVQIGKVSYINRGAVRKALSGVGFVADATIHDAPPEGIAVYPISRDSQGRVVVDDRAAPLGTAAEPFLPNTVFTESVQFGRIEIP